MSRRLIWQFSEGDRTELGVFRDDRVLDLHERPIDWLSSSAGVRLWHPLGSAPELVLEWRRCLERQAVVQPFKQAHREIYLLTGAERITDVYSNRFAAHILRQHQFAALCRERGWTYRLQGDWDSANTPMRRLPRWDLAIEIWVDAPTDRGAVNESGVFPYICTDQVRFSRDGAPIRLEEIPALAFSEGMRDVDLFVGVCSVGNDPDWADRGVGPEPVADYWALLRVRRIVRIGQNTPCSARNARPEARRRQSAVVRGTLPRGPRRGGDLQDSSRLRQRPDGAGQPLLVHRASPRRKAHEAPAGEVAPVRGR